MTTRFTSFTFGLLNKQNKPLRSSTIKPISPPRYLDCPSYRSVAGTLRETQSTRDGLLSTDATTRLHICGPNEIARDKTAAIPLQFLRAFESPFVFVLLALAGISFMTDIAFAAPADRSWTGTSILMTMVIVSGTLRFIQEFRSNRAAEQLKSMVQTTAAVLRRSGIGAAAQRQSLPMRALVVGDIVLLEAGDMVPADIRLIESRDLFISQAALTGEALPVEKYDTLGAVAGKSTREPTHAQASDLPYDDPDAKPNLLDEEHLCFMGSNVVSGTATAIVIGTGTQTYFGALAKNVTHHKRIETSFDRGVNAVSWLLIRFMLVMVPVVFLINGLTKGDWLSALTFGLAVAVGLTPEMLPMIVSANLAKGAMAMARRKVVVKRLNAVQNFGAMDVLCTDKTGTLTQDRIILEQHLGIDGLRDPAVLRLAWLNSFHQSGQKNLMDVAVLAFANKLDGPDALVTLPPYEKIDELPFDFIRRRLSVVVEGSDGQQMMVSKGAVEEMLSVSTHCQDGAAIVPLTPALRDALLTRATALNEQGYRVLVVANRDIAQHEAKQRYDAADEVGLTIRGFLTFLDPPKDSAAAAIDALHQHGVTVKVLTGDNPIVTAKVCGDVGLPAGEPLLGHQIDALDDATLAALVEERTVFAKLTPMQKSRVVKALQANGHTVGFLGDGINDAPALRDADVGISVDTGTDIAKETADIILLEKSLMVLEAGVVKGRETFGNILKYLNMTASSNFGNVFSVLVASAFLPWEPMLAIQLLILNLIYDISQIFLPWDRMDQDFLKQPRKWDASNIGRFMLWLGPTSSVFDMTTFALLWTVFGAGAAYHLNGGGQAIMNSGWFIESMVSQTLVVHMLRTRKIPFFQSTAALPVLLSTSTAILIGCWLPFSPLASSLGFVSLGAHYWFWLALTIVAYMALTQGMKTLYIRRFGRWY